MATEATPAPAAQDTILTTPPTPAAAAPAADTGTPPAGATATGTQTPADPPPAVEAQQTSTESTPPAPTGDLDIKLPEGVAADAVALEEFKPLAKELGLSNEAAQKLVDLQVKQALAAQEKTRVALEQEEKQWLETIKADADFGGANFDASIQKAQRAMEKFATPELAALLKESRLGNHPELVKFAIRVGAAMSEDTISGTGSAGAATPANSQAAFLADMYPNTRWK